MNEPSVIAPLPISSKANNLHDERNRTHESNVYGNTAPVAKVDQTDHGSKTMAIIALVFAGLAIALGTAAFVIVLMQMSFAQQVLDAKITAGVAKSAEEAHQANVRTQLTERDLSIVREALQKKGIDLPPKD